MSYLDTNEIHQAMGGPPGARPRGRPAKRLRYQHVIEVVERLIVERGLAPGGLLPTHKQLAELAGVSLITVRRALEELERAGRVTRHQGVGTFVAHPRIVAEPARLGSLLATLAEPSEPRRVTTRLLELRSAAARPTVARALRITAAMPGWHSRRMRLIDDKPLIIEQALVPVFLAPDLDRARDQLEGSLYDLLARDHGLVDDYEEQFLEVGSPHERERRLLKLSPKASVVRLRGVSFTSREVPFDCFEQVYPADEFVFYISGRTDRQLLRASDLGDWQAAHAATEEHTGEATTAHPVT
jgi:DNA-binding GntR family transcriptional regulator